MTQSRQALVNRALHKLGVIGAGQPAPAEDYAAVDDTLEPVMSDLATRAIFTWGDPDEIPDDAFMHLAECLAQANARDYGLEPDEQKRLAAEARLTQLNLTFLSGQPQTTESF